MFYDIFNEFLLSNSDEKLRKIIKKNHSSTYHSRKRHFFLFALMLQRARETLLYFGVYECVFFGFEFVVICLTAYYDYFNVDGDKTQVIYYGICGHVFFTTKW